MENQSQIHPQALIEMLGQSQAEILALRSALMAARQELETAEAAVEAPKATKN